MALNSNNSSAAIVLPTQDEIDIFSFVLKAKGIANVTTFKTAEAALEVARKQLFDVFITSMELPQMSGIVFIQKLRQTGNYGAETHMFVCDSVPNDLLALLIDLDIPYVFKRPCHKPGVIQKFSHLLQCESELSTSEAMLREARAAYINDVLDLAYELVEKALVLSPAEEKLFILKGDILLKRNDIAGAKTTYQEACLRNDKSLAVAHKLAKVASLEGHLKEAAFLLQKMADLNPYHIKILEDAGVSSFKAELYDDAKKYMNKLVAVDATNVTASTVIADSMIKLGDYDGIISTLQKSHSEKEIIQFLNNAGVKLSKENDVAGALKMYKAAALQLEGKTHLLYAIYYNMGLAYKRTNDKLNAVVCFRHALKLNPGFDKAKQALQEAESKAAS